MAATDFNAILWELKEDYAKFLVSQRNLRRQYLSEFVDEGEVTEIGTGGKYFVIPVYIGGGESVGAGREGGVLPGGPVTSATGGSVALVGDQAHVNVKLIYMTHRISGKAQAAGRKGLKAFVDTLDFDIAQKTKIMWNDMGRQLFGTGMGVLGGDGTALGGGLVSAVAGATITFNANTNMNHFARSMRVDFWNTAISDRAKGVGGVDDNTTEDVGWTISTVNIPGKSITLSADPTGGGGDIVAAGDVCLRENVGIAANGTEGNEITGLPALIQNGDISATLQNLNILTTYPEYQAYVDSFGGNPRDITEDLMQKCDDQASQLGGEDVNREIVTGYGQRRKLLALGLPSVRHVSEQIKLGYKTLSWNGTKIVVDRFCPYGTMFLIDKSQFVRLTMEDWHPLDDSRGERLPHYDIREFAYGMYMNLAVKQTNTSVKIKDLREP